MNFRISQPNHAEQPCQESSSKEKQPQRDPSKNKRLAKSSSSYNTTKLWNTMVRNTTNPRYQRISTHQTTPQPPTNSSPPASTPPQSSSYPPQTSHSQSSSPPRPPTAHAHPVHKTDSATTAHTPPAWPGKPASAPRPAGPLLPPDEPPSQPRRRCAVLACPPRRPSVRLCWFRSRTRRGGRLWRGGGLRRRRGLRLWRRRLLRGGRRCRLWRRGGGRIGGGCGGG